jgi:hypothetical protein
MIPLFLLLCLLSLTWASPAPLLLSIFNDDSITTVNQPGSGLLNFTPNPGNTLKKRASNLPYVLYDVTFDGRNGANWQRTILILPEIKPLFPKTKLKPPLAGL